MKYVTLDEFRNSPVHSIDTSSLVPGGSSADNDAALQSIIETAEAWVDTTCGVETFEAASHTEMDEVRLNRFLELRIRPDSFPLTAVSSVEYRFYPSDSWTTIASTNIDVFDREFVARSGWTTFSIAGQSIIGLSGYRTPYEQSAMRNLMIVLRYTYTSGWTAPTSIPIEIKTATILKAAGLIDQRGSESIDMDGNPSQIGGLAPRHTREDEAREMLRRWKR